MCCANKLKHQAAASMAHIYTQTHASMLCLHECANMFFARCTHATQQYVDVSHVELAHKSFYAKTITK